MTWAARVITAVPFLLRAGAACAHGDHAELSWTLDPYIIGLLALSAGLYAIGTGRVWRHAGFGRGIRAWQALGYSAGWLMLAGALISPLHWLGEHLFSLHMVEHEIVMAGAAPLLALSRPVGAFLWAFPAVIRHAIGHIGRSPTLRRSWRFVTTPIVATMLHGAAIWFWHAPALFEAAVTSDALHRLQHLSFLVTALAFWWALVRRAERGAAVLHVFATMIHMTLLGALITFAGRVFYPDQASFAAEWGLTPLEDQQLAGLIMWVPAGSIYAGAALAFAALWIRRSSRRTRHVLA